MSFIGKIIWFLTGGGFMGVFWYVAGVLGTITIIGMPVGKQYFKTVTLCSSQFGKYVLSPLGGTDYFLLNILWICIIGLSLPSLNR